MKKYIIAFAVLFFIGGFDTFSQTVLGKWKTVNDETGISHSIVEIFKDSETGEVKGRLVEMLKDEHKDKICTLCTGDLKDQPLEGLLIMEGLHKDGDEYVGGKVTDPKTGKVYKCKIWVEKDNPDLLNVRGYISILYRTQVWERVKS
mgnify:CR=1 FL=1